jgi:hypothetical protein
VLSVSLVELVEAISCLLLCSVDLYIEARRACLEGIDSQFTGKHMSNIEGVCYSVEFEQVIVHFLECELPPTE